VVSVCIPVVSDHGLIEGCLDSLADSLPSVDTEAVVVANGLSDDAFASLYKRADDIVLVRSAVNTGFSGGNNLAARFARGRYLLLLNDDSVVEAGFIDRLLSTVERDPLIAAAGGRILSADGTLQEAGSVLWSDGWVAHVGEGLPADLAAYEYVRFADYISANGLMVDRRAWDAVGGLDDRYFPAYYEDVDLCLALLERGYRVAYEPRARLRHLESQSTSTPFRNFLLVRNRAELVAKWSTVLASFSDHPDPIDDAAIDAAVLRATRSVGRVLVLESSADPTAWRLLPTIEVLASAGWSVMVSAPGSERPAESTDGGIKDRLVDLGVDVRVEPTGDLVTRYRDSLDAVVVFEEGAAVGLSLRRPDGSSIPVLDQRDDRDDSLPARLAVAARRGVASAPPVPSHRPENAALVAETPDDPSQRDLEFAEADARILNEYREYLENWLAHLESELARQEAVIDETGAAFRTLAAAFDEKERYIDSLLSVRVKKWIVGRVPNR
jgi:GT2 family glycosyltransferase